MVYYVELSHTAETEPYIFI